ncbi:hypothetical protein F5Y18DRAFT_405609 [Xylariaceae sp. FL1019]|nr:hypothetical protein F5Y18DRAFT_405609 [Xylariaceae sp. FL1019]
MADSFQSLTPEQQEALLNGPALTSPNGQYNFSNPYNLNVVGYVVVSLALAITSIFLFVRFYVRLFVIKRLRLEDYLIIAGYGIFIATSYSVYRLLKHIGIFVHQWDIRLRDLSEFLYVIHLCANLYSAHILVSKAAILLEWIHIFVPTGTRNAFYWACQCLLWVNVLFYTSTIITANLVCIPFEAIWDKTITGKCIDGKVIEVVSASLNLVSDLIILILPQKVIWTLHMRPQKKVGVSILFAIGLLAITAAAFRLQSATLYYSSEDATYVASALILWSLVEMTSLFLILSVPAVPKALHNVKVFQAVKSSLGSWSSRKSKPSAQRSWFSKRGTAANKYNEIDNVAIALDGQPYAVRTTPEQPTDNLYGIYRTSEVTRKTEKVSAQSVRDQQFLKTHPWAHSASRSH